MTPRFYFGVGFGALCWGFDLVCWLILTGVMFACLCVRVLLDDLGSRGWVDVLLRGWELYSWFGNRLVVL